MNVLKKIKLKFTDNSPAKIQVDTSGLKQFADEFRNSQNDNFSSVAKNFDENSRKIIRFLYDNENDVLDIFDRIKAEAVVNNNKKGRRIFGLIVWVFSFVFCVFNIFFLLKIERKIIFLPLMLSLMLFVVLCFLLFSYLQNDLKEDRSDILLNLIIPEKEKNNYFDENFSIIGKKIKEEIDTVISLMNKPVNTDESAVSLISEIYCELYAMKKLERYSNIEGSVLPEFTVLLSNFGLESISEYNSENSNYFLVDESSDMHKTSFVLRPAVIRRQDGRVIKPGRYIKGGQ